MSNAASQARLRERRKAADPAAWSALCTATQARFRARHPEKKAAWNAVYKALKSGRAWSAPIPVSSAVATASRKQVTTITPSGSRWSGSVSHAMWPKTSN